MATKTVETDKKQLQITVEDIFRLVEAAARRGDIRVDGLTPASRLWRDEGGKHFAATFGECQPFGTSGVSQIVKIENTVGLTLEGGDKVALPEGSYIPTVRIEWVEAQQ